MSPETGRSGWVRMKIQTERSLGATGWAPCCLWLRTRSRRGRRVATAQAREPSTPCCLPGRQPPAGTGSPGLDQLKATSRGPWTLRAQRPSFLRSQVGSPFGVCMPTGLPRGLAVRCPWSARPEKARDGSPRLLAVSLPRDQLSCKKQIHEATFTKTETRRKN